MLLAVLSGFLLAALAPAAYAGLRSGAGWVLAVLPAALLVYFTGFVGPVANGEVLRESLAWLPSLGVTLSFTVDGLSLVFALLITGIGTFIIVYAGGYLGDHPHLGRFYAFLLMFMASMLGLVLADNIITFFIFWELTSLTSFLLIGFNHHKAASRRAAVQALVVTGGGGLILLAGLLLMASIGGSLEFSELLSQGDIFRDHQHYTLLLILILGGAFTKSAQFQFHFWLPDSMEAPTPVSAYLHSATMVKAGVYLLARVHPALGDTDLWMTILPVFGGVTFIVGVILGLRQTDLKLMLAYTTVASLGLLVMLLGLGTEKAVVAAVTYLIAHSLFKGALFMIAGGIDHSTGTRDRTRLGGLWGAMPITAVASLLAVLSMAGLPPFIGFLAKEVIYAGTLALPTQADLVTWVAVGGNIMMGAIAFLAGVGPFMGTKPAYEHAPHEGSLALWIGPMVLAVLGLVSTLVLGFTEHAAILPAASAIWGSGIDIHLHLWAGINMPLILSIITVVGALALFWLAGPVTRLLTAVIDRLWGPDRGYDQALWGLRALARLITGVLQTGRLRSYVFITVATFVAAVLIPMAATNAWPAIPALPEADFFVYAVCLLIVGGAVAVLITPSRLEAILLLGVVGVAVALVFLLFGAPDLAFTQFMVEILAVVVLALIILRLPVDRKDQRGPLAVLRDATVAIAAGVCVTLILLAITAEPFDARLSEYFAANSYPEAKGRNIVNVILVDFRALDTLGEIAVLVIAGIAGLALIGARALGRRETVRDNVVTATDPATVHPATARTSGGQRA